MREKKYDWREDSSNSERKYNRNKIRLDLIPSLEAIVGGKNAIYARMCDIEDQSTELRQFLEFEVYIFEIYINNFHDTL